MKSFPMPARIVWVLAVLISSAAGQSSPPAETKPPELPKFYYKHGEQWPIIKVKQLDGGATGRTYCDLHLIKIDEKVARPEDVADTVIHEVMHAMGCAGGEAHDEVWNNSNDDSDGQEGHAGIYRMAKEIVDFIAENPELVKFVQYYGALGK